MNTCDTRKKFDEFNNTLNEFISDDLETYKSWNEYNDIVQEMIECETNKKYSMGQVISIIIDSMHKIKGPKSNIKLNLINSQIGDILRTNGPRSRKKNISQDSINRLFIKISKEWTNYEELYFRNIFNSFLSSVDMTSKLIKDHFNKLVSQLRAENDKNAINLYSYQILYMICFYYIVDIPFDDKVKLVLLDFAKKLNMIGFCKEQLERANIMDNCNVINDNNSSYCLFDLVENYDTNKAQKIFESEEKFDVNLNITNDNGVTLLSAAIYSENAELVSLLLSNGADPNYYTDLCNTPIRIATKELGNVEITRLLVSKNADPRIYDKEKCDPLLIEIINSNWNDQVVYLIDEVLKHNDVKSFIDDVSLLQEHPWTPLAFVIMTTFIASLNDDEFNRIVRITKSLLDAGADTNIDFSLYQKPFNIDHPLFMINLLTQYGFDIETLPQYLKDKYHEYKRCSNKEIQQKQIFIDSENNSIKKYIENAINKEYGNVDIFFSKISESCTYLSLYGNKDDFYRFQQSIKNMVASLYDIDEDTYIRINEMDNTTYFTNYYNNIFYIKPNIRFQFVDEEGNLQPGVDAGGLKTQYFTTLANKLIGKSDLCSVKGERKEEVEVSDDEKVFIQDINSRNNGYQINPDFSNFERYNYGPEFYFVIGSIIASGIIFEKKIGIYFTYPLLALINGYEPQTMTLETLLALHNVTYNNNMFFNLEAYYDYQEDMTFADYPEVFGITYQMANGQYSIIQKNTKINEDNFLLYLKALLIQNMFNDKMKSFVNGIHSVIPKENFYKLTLQQINLLFSCDIDRNDIINKIKSNNDNNIYVQALVTIILYDLTDDEINKLLIFWTASYCPPELKIHLVERNIAKYPAAHTCFNTLDIPKYEGEYYDEVQPELLENLREAIAQGTSFGMAGGKNKINKTNNPINYLLSSYSYWKKYMKYKTKILSIKK
jgi:ankyrin repeat protein